MARLDSKVGDENVVLRTSLQALVQELGSRREEARVKQQQEHADRQAEEAERQAALLAAGGSGGYAAKEPRRPASSTAFCGDLVLREEETGFELWLGSLEDALNLRGLRERGISAVLNCALDDCEAEIAGFKPKRCYGRARAHTRNQSMEDGTLGNGSSWIGLHRDQIWALASFDADWYSDVLEWDVAYEALTARDEAGYDMREHFVQVTDFLAECRKGGRKVLVHCVMGINRSVSATIAFLVGAMGMSLKAAVELTAGSRGVVLNNTSFLDQLITSFGNCKQDDT
eukprot:TRINITY_DN65971_c0_g1_i1.p1 TRINITY_DN65971_c0_g1~~TRINITY_DN65971_c0_g1_i1.p1  ORF type:complete len:296 (-),score=77.81 TRINITY_DN65971_c0_g1_i1:130-987(-)